MEPQQHISLARLAPNLVTLGSLCSGLSSIRFAMLGKWEIAVGLLVLAAILDGLDGRLARLLKATSNFGAQLDSLCDFVCFGVAPIIVMYMWKLESIRGLGWALVLFFAICSALRLARFNTSLMEEKKEEWQKHFFTGVPAPAGAMLCILPLVLSMQFGEDILDHPFVVAAYTIPIALLMISRIPTFSVKSQRVPREFLLPITISAITILVGFVIEPWATFTVLAICYLASIPFSCWQKAKLMKSLNRSASSAQ
jgi:CDP-diacylglycerol---serine O-phosphatidyltransferase